MKDIAPHLFEVVSKKPKKKRTVQEALVERRWISDITGAPSPLALWQYFWLWIRLREVLGGT